MNINEILVWTSSLLALVLYYPLIAGILRDKIKQNCVTWLLWVALDLIALVSIINQKGNYMLLVSYCGCGWIVIGTLIYKKQFKWTSFETFVLSLVVICLVIWYMSGSHWATIASTLAVVISGFPQIRDSWNTPDRTTGHIYMGYVFANGLSFLGGKAWTIEDKFYPGMMTLLCLAIGCAAYRKLKSPNVAQVN